MADLQIKVGGAWKSIDDALIKVGGAWKGCDAVFIKVGGAWEQVWPGQTFTLANRGISDTGFTARTYTAGIRINGNGTAQKLINTTYSATATGEWADPSGDFTGYYVRATEVSTFGTATRSGTLNSWLALTSDRLWTIASATAGFKEWVLDIDIASDAAGTNIVCTGAMSLSVEYAP